MASGMNIAKASVFNRPNHILHLLLSIFTLGFWVIVWILIALNGGPKTLSATVDNFGNIHVN